MKRFSLIGLIFALAVLAGGCASYSTKSVNPTQIDESKLVKDTSNDIAVVAFPILTEKDSKDYFDENLIGEKVLAVYMSILNNTSEEIKFVSSNLSVQSDNKKLTFSSSPLATEDVYKYIKRSYAGKSIFWMSFTYFVGAPISAAHTKSVNNKIEKDLQAKILKFGNIKSKESIQGFLWFRLSDDLMSEQNAKLVLRLIFEQNNGVLVGKDLLFPVPTVD